MTYSSRLELIVDSRTGERRLKSFRGELDRTEGSGRNVTHSLNLTSASFSALAQTAKLAGGVLIGVGAGLGLASRQAGETAARIINLSKLANTSVEQFQRMTYAAAEYGIQQDKLADILKDMNDRVGDFMATGGGPMADFFEQIAPKVGVTADEFRNLSGPQALQLYFDSLEKANLSQADMTFYLEAMASDATALIPVLQDSGREIKRLGDEADDLNAVLSEIELQRLKELRGEFNKLEQQLSTETMRAVSQFDDLIKSSLEGISWGINRTARGFNLFMDNFRDEENKRSIAGINSELQQVFDNRQRLERDIEIFGKDSERGRNAATAMAELKAQYDALIDRKKELITQGPAVEEPEVVTIERVSTATGDAAEEALRLARGWYTARDAAYDSLQSVADKIDPVGAELRSLTADISVVREAFSRGFITAEQADDIVNALNDPKHWEETGKKSAEAFINPWQSAADTVAQSLQDAIASGDWDDIGDAIGGALGSSIAAIVNKQVTDSLAKDLTANSSTLAQIGGAFAGPIAGAVAGGAIQMAVSELSDFFSGSDWDPTAARQAAQGTGTILGSIDAKSESIANSVDIAAKTNEQLVNINTGMLRALQNVQAGIQGAVAMTLRQSSGLSFGQMSAGAGASEGFGLVGGGFTQIGAGLFDDTLEILTFGLVDGVFEGILDSTIGFLDNLTGGLLSDIGSSVFGGDQKVVDEGIRILGGNLSDLVNETLVQAYATIKEDGGWFRSDKRFDKFQSIATNQFTLAFESMYDSVEAGAAALGILPETIQSRLDAFVVETQRISLEDMNAGEKQAEIEAVFSTIFDDISGAAVPFLTKMQDAGEGLGETLARVATQVGVMNEAIIATGAAFDRISPEQISMSADRLTDLFGGIEAFTQALTGYESNFLTEEQQLANLERRLTGGLNGIDLPATRQAYADLVAAQRLSVAGDQERYATLLQLQDAAAQYYRILESGAEDAEQAADQFSASLKGLTDDALADLKNAVQAGRGIIQEEYDARMTANRLALDAARGGLQAIEEEVRGIQSARSSLSQQYDPVSDTVRQTALSTLTAALATGNLSGTGAAAGMVGDINPQQFSTRADYLREQGRTLNILGRLDEVGGDQLSTAEQAVLALERQTDKIEKQYRDEMFRLDEILQNGSDQVNAARGIQTAVLSVRDAVAALTAQLGVEVVDPGQGFDKDAQRQDFIKSLYESIGRDIGSVTQSEISFWMAEGLGMTAEQLRSEFLRSASLYSGDADYGVFADRASQMLSGLPQFADGGIASGPVSGYPAMLHGSEAVIPLKGGAIPMRMKGDPQMLAEIAQLRRENSDLMKQLLTKTAAIEDYTRTIRNIQRERATA